MCVLVTRWLYVLMNKCLFENTLLDKNDIHVQPGHILLSKAEGEVGIPLIGLSPKVIFYIADRSKAVILIWFSVFACFSITLCSVFTICVSKWY